MHRKGDFDITGISQFAVRIPTIDSIPVAVPFKGFLSWGPSPKQLVALWDSSPQFSLSSETYMDTVKGTRIELVG